MQMKNLEDLKVNFKSKYENLISGLNFNDYLERYISKLKGIIQDTLNPLVLEPLESTFEYGGWPWKFNGNLLLDNTKLYNLNYIRRSGVPKAKIKDKVLNLSWQMVFPEPVMTSNFVLTLFNSTNSGEIKTKVTDLLADVEFHCELDKVKPKLHRLSLTTDKTIDVEISGEDSVDKVRSILVKAVANVFKKQILEAVEDAVKEKIEEALEGVQLLE